MLVIEDQPFTRELVCYLLRKVGHTAIEAGDGERGLELALAEDHDLILVDLGLPRLGGAELVRKIRAQRNRSRTLIVAVTAAYVEGEDPRTTLKKDVIGAGFDFFFPKPIDDRTLVKKLEKLVSLHKNL